MIHSGEKRAHQMPCLETHGWVLKFCVCELLCWHHMDILCAWSLPEMTLWESIILRARDSNALPLPDFAHEVWPRCCLSQTQLPLVTRYHREFNEPLAMCGLFIDGGHRKLSVSQWGDNNSWLPGGIWVIPVYLAVPNHPILAFSCRKTLRNQGKWVKASFVLDWDISNN